MSRLPAVTFWCGGLELLVLFFIVFDFPAALQFSGFYSFTVSMVGLDYANHDGSQKNESCEKGNHVQVPYKGHLSAPDYLYLTGRY